MATTSLSPQESEPLSLPDDLTIDQTIARSPLVLQTRAAPLRPVASPIAANVELVEGETATSQENQVLLAKRLQVAARALGFGFLVFSIWSWTRTLLFVSGDTPMWLLVGQLATAVTLLSLWLWLRTSPRLNSKSVQVAESAIFGLPAIFFGVVHYKSIVFTALNFELIPTMQMASWVLLIFAYAFFVPNTWQRVLIVSICMALIPIVATLFAIVYHPSVRSSLGFDFSSAIEMVLVLGTTIFVAVLGVRMITQLRLVASEAKQLGRYRLKEKIGSGGMGDVYLAEHVLMKRPCAIKVIRPEKAGDPKALARFEREVQATAQLSHWNSIYIYDYGRTQDGTFFYVMEYLSGLSVQEIVRHGGPMSPGRAVYLLRQVCEALIEAHCQKLIHRDIKPANILVTELGSAFDVAKLLDFGLVKPMLPSKEDIEEDLTQAGAVTGSPLYMSPEQALGESEADPRSDIYSIGCVAFFMLTGRPLFETGSPMRIMMSHMNELPAAPSISRQSTTHEKILSAKPISPDLDQVVLKCLAKRPDDRYQSTLELADALDSLPERNQWSGRKAQAWWRSNCANYQTANG